MPINNIPSATILVIDDDEINLEIIEELLEDTYFNISFFQSPVAAIEHYQHTPPDIVLLDINMPEMTGFEVLKKFDVLNFSPRPPVLMITALNDHETRLKALNSGARDFISKPFNGQELSSRIHNLLEMHLAHKKNHYYAHNLENLVAEKTQELRETQQEIIQCLGLAAEFRDKDTASHTIRVGLYAEVLAKHLGLNATVVEQLRFAVPMHDIGKIGIPDKVLLKETQLNAEDWAIMQKHSLLGYNILKESKSKLLKIASIIALTHHEKWDGSGYPFGLKGEAIHLHGRITGLVDVFDALTMERPYKTPWSVEATVELINNESGKHFDPKIVRAFNDSLDSIIYIKDNNL